MGKRKLQFDVRKNYELNRKIKSLKIAIPFNLVTVHRDSRCIPTMADSTGLTVKVPVSAYTSTMVSDAAVLHTKLQNVLPSTWCMSFLPGVSPVQSTLALYKLVAVPQSLTADVMFMLSIAHDCSWTLSAAGKTVNVEHCQRLSGVPSRFSCVDEVSKLLSALDGSSLCIGNPDVKFMGLLNRHNDGFKDQSGKILYSVILNNLHCTCRYKGYCIL